MNNHKKALNDMFLEGHKLENDIMEQLEKLKFGE